ncbi:MAG: superoxide dismutase family protein [Sphingosinicella sp.]|nr:superoxide dismutase family protein [Sphingosinicella sp.]
MIKLRIGAVMLGGLAATGCASFDDGEPAVPPAPYAASADLRNAAGLQTATATATQVGNDIRVRVEGVNLPMGAHGVHVHMVGLCTAPGFESAGGHWNPTGHKHGKDNPAGMHKGDLPNILIGTDGRGTLEYTIPNGMVAGANSAMLDGDGAALVVHANPDDHRTDPSGNSGGRIACGILR